MKIQYAIIENEFYALEHLKTMVSTLYPNYELVYTSESVEESIRYFKQQPKLDFVFMDIELVDGNCFEIFSKVEINIPIIFTTAYNQFAIKAFSVNSIQYILKPVTENKVEEAILKWQKLTNFNNLNHNYNMISQLINKSSTKERVLIVKNDSFVSIDTNDIAFFISEDKYILLETFLGERLITDYKNLQQVEKDIGNTHFFLVSRNIFMNHKSIIKAEKYFNGRLLLRLKPGLDNSQNIIVSAAKRELFLKWLGGSVK